MKNELTPIKAIRKWCLSCAGNKPSLVRWCDSQNCPLYSYRLGKNPRRTGIGGRKALSTSKSLTQVEVLKQTQEQEGVAV